MGGGGFLAEHSCCGIHRNAKIELILQQRPGGGGDVCCGAAVIADKYIRAGERITVSYTGGTTIEEAGWDRVFECKCCACMPSQVSGSERRLCYPETKMKVHNSAPTHGTGAAVLFPEHILKTWPVEGEGRAECGTNRPGYRGRKEGMQSPKGWQKQERVGESMRGSRDDS